MKWLTSNYGDLIVIRPVRESSVYFNFWNWNKRKNSLYKFVATYVYVIPNIT